MRNSYLARHEREKITSHFGAAANISHGSREGNQPRPRDMIPFERRNVCAATRKSTKKPLPFIGVERLSFSGKRVFYTCCDYLTYQHATCLSQAIANNSRSGHRHRYQKDAHQRVGRTSTRAPTYAPCTSR